MDDYIIENFRGGRGGGGFGGGRMGGGGFRPGPGPRPDIMCSPNY